ncbi:hypothetical protein [Burkholderia anthina]|uniref:hypothetical protein n=1 Tax=Burkholderia anthina TaxID=179879 RepID=UPI00158A0DEB
MTGSAMEMAAVTMAYRSALNMNEMTAKPTGAVPVDGNVVPNDGDEIAPDRRFPRHK